MHAGASARAAMHRKMLPGGRGRCGEWLWLQVQASCGHLGVVFVGTKIWFGCSHRSPEVIEQRADKDQAAAVATLSPECLMTSSERVQCWTRGIRPS